MLVCLVVVISNPLHGVEWSWTNFPFLFLHQSIRSHVSGDPAGGEGENATQHNKAEQKHTIKQRSTTQHGTHKPTTKLPPIVVKIRRANPTNPIEAVNDPEPDSLQFHYPACILCYHACYQALVGYVIRFIKNGMLQAYIPLAILPLNSSSVFASLL